MARPMSRKRRRSRFHVQPGAHATFNGAGGATDVRGCKHQRADQRQRRQRHKRQSFGWTVALGASDRGPCGRLVVLCLYGRTGEPLAATEPASDARAVMLALEPIALPIEVTALEVAELLPADAPPPLARPWDAPPGEARQPDRADARARGRRRRDHLPPASDSGLEGARRPNTPSGSIARRCGRVSPTEPPRRSRRSSASRAARFAASDPPRADRRHR